MKVPSPDRFGPLPDSPSHTDPDRWQQLIRELEPASMLVVIPSSMSTKLREHCTPEDIWQDAGARLARGEREAAVRKALSELLPGLEQVVRMHLLEELTMEVIAGRFGIGLSAAWHRLSKGSEILARILPGGTSDGSSGA